MPRSTAHKNFHTKKLRFLTGKCPFWHHPLLVSEIGIDTARRLIICVKRELAYVDGMPLSFVTSVALNLISTSVVEAPASAHSAAQMFNDSTTTAGKDREMLVGCNFAEKLDRTPCRPPRFESAISAISFRKRHKNLRRLEN